MIKASRRTQPLRKKLRQNGTAYVINMRRGSSPATGNPKDASRGAANGTGGVQAPPQLPGKRRGATSPKGPPPAGKVTPLPQVTGKRSGRGGPRGGLGQALREAAGRVNRAPKGKGERVLPQDRPRTYQTTRGKRRLSFEEAYARRTTDTSRARVEALYDKKATPEMRAAATENRSLAPGEQRLSEQARADNYGGLADKMRGQAPKRARRRRSGPSRLIDRTV